MIQILVLEDDAKLNQTVCTYLNDSGFQAKGLPECHRCHMMSCITACMT